MQISTQTELATNPQLLIIDDNADVLTYLKTILKGQYQISTARDGREGLKLTLAEIPDIIISDIMMPNMDGLEFCKTIKSDFRTNHIPVILLTARADIDSRVTGLQTGADAYLSKPFNKSELFVELEKLHNLRETLKRKYRHLPTGVTTDGKTLGPNERFLHDVNEILDRNFMDDGFGIHDLNEGLNVSRTQLHRKLVALTGMSTSHYIRAFRLAKAVGLLQSTRMTVAEVAYAVGFSDPNYFSRTFAKEFGITPVKARENPPLFRTDSGPSQSLTQ